MIKSLEFYKKQYKVWQQNENNSTKRSWKFPILLKLLKLLHGIMYLVSKILNYKNKKTFYTFVSPISNIWILVGEAPAVNMLAPAVNVSKVTLDARDSKSDRSKSLSKKNKL